MQKSRETLISLFKDIDPAQKQLAIDTIDEYIMFAQRIAELRTMPFIRIDKNDASKQQLTPAAKLIKDYSNCIDAKRKILLTILNRDGKSQDGNNLIDLLKQFEE